MMHMRMYSVQIGDTAGTESTGTPLTCTQRLHRRILFLASWARDRMVPTAAADQLHFLDHGRPRPRPWQGVCRGRPWGAL